MMLVETTRDERDFLLGAFGKTANQRISFLLNIEGFESVSYFHVKRLIRNIANLAHKLQELGHCKTRVERRVLRKIAYNPFRILRILHNVVRVQSYGPLGRLEYSHNNLEERGLARTVWTQKNKDFASANSQGDIVEGNYLSIVF